MAGDMVAQRGLATLVAQSYCPLAPQRNEKRSTLTKKGVYSSYAGAFYHRCSCILLLCSAIFSLSSPLRAPASDLFSTSLLVQCQFRPQLACASQPSVIFLRCVPAFTTTDLARPLTSSARCFTESLVSPQARVTVWPLCHYKLPRLGRIISIRPIRNQFRFMTSLFLFIPGHLNSSSHPFAFFSSVSSCYK